MIIGAGLTGLIAAHAFPRHAVVDRMPEPMQCHKALLRFRSDAVARLTGIDFHAVKVRKDIWFNGDSRSPSIRLANMYSHKVLGRLEPRSIWNLNSEVRYIAPDNFYEQLVAAVGKRIQWNNPVDMKETVAAAFEAGAQIITTAPLPDTLDSLGIRSEVPDKFERWGIHVKRFLIEDAHIHQTIYFPSVSHTLYRASITGDTLICEFIGEPSGFWWEEVETAFCIRLSHGSELESVKQTFGKILPMTEATRKATLARLTRDYNIYSIGRFATWRNTLLDDVVQDAFVIKRLMESGAYDRNKIAATQSGTP